MMVRAKFLSLIGIALTSLGLAAAASAQEEAKMGLAERRAVKAYQDGTYQEHLKAIHAAAGFEVPVEVQWEKVALPGQAPQYSDPGFWDQIYFQPLVKALGQVAQDDMGKEALKKGLQKIVITYDADTAPASNYPNGLTFDAGVLTINFAPFSNAGDETSSNFQERVAAIVGALEPKL